MCRSVFRREQLPENRFHRCKNSAIHIYGWIRKSDVGQAFLIERQVFFPKTGKVRTDLAYGITDLIPASTSPDRLLKLNRDHWGIENCLHWVRDVMFYEDRFQVRKCHGPQVLASLRNFTIGLLRPLIKDKRTSIPSISRCFAAKPELALSAFTG